MSRNCVGRALVLAGLVAFAAAAAQAQEVIQLRTGQAGGSPGVCGQIDDSFRYNPTGVPTCPAPFRGGSFTAADFAGATTGPKAAIIPPLSGTWMPTLPSDPQARWINWQQSGCAGLSNSVLYACPFTVTTSSNPCPLIATIDLCWAIDDWLGDPSGPNPVGVYVNGTALDPGFSGGSYASQTCRTQVNVPVNTGTNWLYIYQRDLGCTVSGVILSARITVWPKPRLLVYKFEDANGNGFQDGAEQPLAGFTFNAFGPSGSSATSNASGIADFGCVLPGSYIVSEATQPGWVVTTPPSGSQSFPITVGQDYALNFGNRHCASGGAGCVWPPACATAHFPFNECSGPTGNEVLANRDGTLTGPLPPTWGGGRPGSSCGLHFSGAQPGFVQVPDANEHDFGTGSFTVSAWVRTSSSNGAVRTFIDKRQGQSGVTGYCLFLFNNQLWFQYDDGVGAWTNHASTAPAINNGAWHHVGVSVCRYPTNPSANVTRLYVDGSVDTFTGSSIPTGSLSNSVGLRMGDQCPDYLPGTPFDGDLDDVLLFKCCLSPAQFAALGASGEYCYDSCYVPSIVTTSASAIQTTLTICNYSATPQSYTWSIAGLPIGQGCSVAGPSVFSPLSGTVTLPGATLGPACTSVPIIVQLPGGMPSLATSCYQVTVLNTETGKCCTTKGTVRRSPYFSPSSDPANPTLLAGESTPISFSIENQSDAPAFLPYEIATHSADGDESNDALKLNGLPPGEPVIGTLTIPPHQTGHLVVLAELTAFQPLNVLEVLLSADLSGGGGEGALLPLVVSSIRSAPDPAPAGVPQAPAVEATSLPVTILAVPNPFHERVSIRLAIPSSEPSMRVEVFDAGGRLVRRVLSGPIAAGEHLVPWDSRDTEGRLCPTGIYFVRAAGRRGSTETKVIRLE